MAEQEVILHTKYRYKPENDDRYLTLYFENGTDDIIVDTNIEGVPAEDDGTTKLTSVLSFIAETLKNRAYKTVYDTASSLKAKNIVLRQGQFAVESDTGKIKVGDGLKAWNALPYSSFGNNEEGGGGSGGGDEPTPDPGPEIPDEPIIIVPDEPVETPDEEVVPVEVDETSTVAATIDGTDVEINLEDVSGFTDESEVPEEIGVFVKVLEIVDEPEPSTPEEETESEQIEPEP